MTPEEIELFEEALGHAYHSRQCTHDTASGKCFCGYSEFHHRERLRGLLAEIGLAVNTVICDDSQAKRMVIDVRTILERIDNESTADQAKDPDQGSEATADNHP